MNMTNLEGKLDFLGVEMQRQTVMMQGMNTVLGEISSNTKTMGVTMHQDQTARQDVYNRLTDGVLKLAKVMAIGMFLILSMLSIALFKINFYAEHGDSIVKMGTDQK